MKNEQNPNAVPMKKTLPELWLKYTVKAMIKLYISLSKAMVRLYISLSKSMVRLYISLSKAMKEDSPFSYIKIKVSFHICKLKQ